MVYDERSLKEAPIWNHLTQVIGQVVQQKPAHPLDVVESFSTFVREGKLVPHATTTTYMDQRPKPSQKIPASAASDTRWAETFALQVNPPKPLKKADDDEEPQAQEDRGELPDIVTEQATFSLFGEGLEEIESYRVMVALKRLLDKEPLAKVRLWGKVLGTQRDYYVCEAKIDESKIQEKEGGEQEEPAEPTGKPPETIFQALNTYRAPDAVRVPAEEAKGVNEYKYYVATSDDLTNWVQLPDVLPQHITAARKICKFFSGYLDAEVDCHPPFPGVERHYLRAQIARIAHACTVCPKNIYSTDAAEEEEEEDENGEKKPKRYEVKPYEEVPALNPQEPPDAEDAEAVAPLKVWFFGYKHDELMEPCNWVHIAPQILDEGRATKFKPETGDQEDEDADKVKVKEELINPFLSDLAHDHQMRFTHHSRGSFPAWTVRKVHANPSSIQRGYLAKSVLWPGALCFAIAEDDKPGARFQNCYVGWGVKNQGGILYAPKPPPIPCTEFPTPGLLLQKDCTRDDELEFEPPPQPVAAAQEGDEENPEEDA